MIEEKENQILEGWDRGLNAEDRSAGGVIYRPYKRVKDGKEGYLVSLIERSQTGWWDLPKGHLEEGETDEQAATREVEEETGLRGQIVAELGDSRYVAETKKGSVRKLVRWFLMQDLSANLVKPRPQPGENYDAIWCDIDDAIALVYFENSRVILRRARRWLLQNAEKSK